jgi:hypothetical protein
MFDHAETIVLFSLSLFQGLAICDVLQRETGLLWFLAFIVGCVLGFVLAAIELTFFSWLFYRKK